VEENRFIIPGEKLGVIEEYLPGNGTYVDNGVIYSMIVGHVLVDKLNKKISVEPCSHHQLAPQIGDFVIGQVINVQEKAATIRISKIGNQFTSGFFTGILHISDLSDSYVRTMSDAVRVGDIIKAKVVSTTNRVFHLTTADKKLGLVYAFCPNCNNRLVLKNNELFCSFCKVTEKRIISSDYGGEIDIK